MSQKLNETPIREITKTKGWIRNLKRSDLSVNFDVSLIYLLTIKFCGELGGGGWGFMENEEIVGGWSKFEFSTVTKKHK